VGYKDAVEFGLHVFQIWKGIKLYPSSNAWIAIKDFREKQTGNDRNCLQDTELLM